MTTSGRLFIPDTTDRGSRPLRLVSADLCVPSASRHILRPMTIPTPTDPLPATRATQGLGRR